MKKLLLFFILVFNLAIAEVQVNQEGFFSGKFHTIKWSKTYSGALDLERLKNNPQLDFFEEDRGIIKNLSQWLLKKRN